MNEQRPGGSPFFALLRERSAGCQAVAVALQEVEVGGSSIALGAAKDVIAKSLQVRSHRGLPCCQCPRCAGPAQTVALFLRRLSPRRTRQYAECPL